MGQVYQCWWRICREINVFSPGSKITCFTFYIHLWSTYLLTLPRNKYISELKCLLRDYVAWFLTIITEVLPIMLAVTKVVLPLSRRGSSFPFLPVTLAFVFLLYPCFQIYRQTLRVRPFVSKMKVYIWLNCR
jgi:hypothetical protein